MLSGLDDLHLGTYFDTLTTFRVFEQRHHLHAQHGMAARTFIDIPARLLERAIGFLAVFDAGQGVDVGEVAACGAAADVVIEVSGADDFPVVFCKGGYTGDLGMKS